MFSLKLFGMIAYSVGLSTMELLLFPIRFWQGDLFSPWVRRISWGMRLFSGLRTEIHNKHYLEQESPAIYMGNHQSAMDMATFGEHIPPRTTGIGKQEILFLPIVGWYFRLSGGILLNRKDRKSALRRLKIALDHLERGKSIAILPEGTRNPDGVRLLPFKKGGFHLAVQSGRPIVPVVCSSLREFAHFPTRTLRSGKVHMEVLPPISTAGKTEADVDALLAHVHGLMTETFHRLNSKTD